METKIPPTPELPGAHRFGSTPKLNTALALAQGKFRQPECNKKVEVYSKPPERRFLYTFWYADLAEIIDCIREPLALNGLSFTQRAFPNGDGRTWLLILTLHHSSGEIMFSEWPVDLSGPPQDVGGRVTFLKRYQLSAFFGLAADRDDDATGASGNIPEVHDTGRGGAAQNQGKVASQKPAPPKTAPPQAVPPAARDKATPNIPNPPAKPKSNVYNHARGSIGTKAKFAIEKLASEKNIDLVRYLEPAMLNDLSEAEAAELYRQLNASPAEKGI